MSKARVPRLPPGANRAAVQAYVKEVRRYAQVEFKRGASEHDVYASVNQAGISLPALRSVLSREYLAYLGITDPMIKRVRYIGMACAFLFYFYVTSHIVTESPIYRFAIPMMLAVSISFGIEGMATKFWKWRRRPGREKALPQ